MKTVTAAIAAAGLFRPRLVLKFFSRFPSYQIFRHIYGALNINEK